MKFTILKSLVGINIIIKIIFLLSLVTLLYLDIEKKTDTLFYKKTDSVRQNSDYWFKISMSVLIIFLFFPHKNKDFTLIHYEERLLLFIFGWFLLISEIINPYLNPILGIGLKTVCKTSP